MLISAEKKRFTAIVNLEMKRGGLCDVSFSCHRTDTLPLPLPVMSQYLETPESTIFKGVSRKNSQKIVDKYGELVWDFLGYGEQGFTLDLSDLRFISDLLHTTMQWVLNLKAKGKYYSSGLVFWPCDKARFIATKRIVQTFVKNHPEFYLECSGIEIIFLKRKGE